MGSRYAEPASLLWTHSSSIHSTAELRCMPMQVSKPLGESGGPRGPEPTRYGTTCMAYKPTQQA